MAEPKLNTTYQCRRAGKIAFESSIGGALMCKIPYESFDEDPIAGTHSICIGAKDGTMQEIAIKNLMDIFKVENLIDLTTLELPAEPTHEFDLSDWEAKEKYPGFRWINHPRQAQSIDSVLEKWGGKIALFSNKPQTEKVAPKAAAKLVEKKAEPKAEMKPATPKRTLAAKTPEKPKHTWTGESLVEALAVKHGVDKENQDAMNTLGNDIYFPVCDKLFGAGNMPETPEQLEQAAVELGL